MVAPEIVSEYRALLGEGPVWDQRHGRLIFVDILRGHVNRIDPESGQIATTNVGETVTAAMPRAQGGLLLTTRAGFAVLHDDGTLEPLASIDIENEPGARMNNAICDPLGRCWAGTLNDRPERGLSSLYRFDANHTTTHMLGGIGISNGTDWSPDGETMYYVDTPTGRVDTFRFDLSSGTIHDRRRFIEIPPDEGSPDGLTVDAEGGIWVALFAGSCVRRYSPEGRLEEVVELPTSLVTSCAFGGEGLDDLYITTAAHELDLPDPLAGAVFRARPGVRGRACTPFAG